MARIEWHPTRSSSNSRSRWLSSCEGNSSFNLVECYGFGSHADSEVALAQGDFAVGVATKSVTLYKVEAGVTFTATEPPASTVTGTSSGVPLDPGHISAHNLDSSVTGNATGSTSSPVTVTITLLDTWRNPISGVLSSNITLSGTNSVSYTHLRAHETDSY